VQAVRMPFSWRLGKLVYEEAKSPCLLPGDAPRAVLRHCFDHKVSFSWPPTYNTRMDKPRCPIPGHEICWNGGGIAATSPDVEAA